MEHTLTWDDFMKIDMRVGTIISAEVLTEARNPAYKIVIDFGNVGIRRSSAQITKFYQSRDLAGKQVIAVVNFPPKNIAGFQSECLILGVMGKDREVTLLQPERETENGLRIG